MKKILMIVFIAILSFGVNSQVEIPQLSPRAVVKQVVGLTNFTLDYSRPSARDREIFGGLLPYGELWRTGANKNTTLSFDTDITFGGKQVKAGTYAVFLRINEKNWDLYLYSDTENWGVPKEWEESKVVAALTLPIEKSAAFKETFTISFENLTTENLELNFSWADKTARVKVEMPTKILTLASIEKTMSGPTDRDYYGAADYYLSRGENLDQALEYIKKAVEMRGDEAYWYLRKQALIEYELGQKKAAINSANRSLESAEKAGNKSYVEMNKKSIEEWSK